MVNLRLAFPTLLLCSAVGSSNAQVVQQGKGYLILIKYSKGQVIRQNMTMSAASIGKSTTAQIVTKCLNLDKKGIATLDVTIPGAAGKKGTSRTVKVDRHGKPVGNTIDGFSGNFMWPEKPIRVGQAWKGDMNMSDTGQGKGSMKATYKFVGIKTVDKVKVAVVNAYMDVTGQYDIAGTGTINIRVSDGQIHSAVFHMGMSQYNEGAAPTVLKLVMTLRNAS